MKRMIASASAVVLGAAGVQAAYLPAYVSADKPWSVSATLRGFYDDNYYLAANDGDKEESFGVEVRPSVSVGLNREQTIAGLRYTYGMRWYEARPENNVDQSHQVDAFLNHRFTERYSVDITDSFVVTVEPELIDPQIRTAVRRTEADNIRNLGSINFHAQMTRLFGIELGYANVFYDYSEDGGTWWQPSYSGLLDRIEHLIHLDTRWQMLPQTVGVLGYQFGQVNYTGDEPVALIGPFPFRQVKSDIRDSRSHYVYAGLEHAFRPDLSGRLRGGAQITEFFNESGSPTSVTPYVDLSLRYRYAIDSRVELGFLHTRNATDVIQRTPGSRRVTTDQESSVVYGSITHRLLPKLYGSLLGQFQQSTFKGGDYDGKADTHYIAGVNLDYRFNRHFSAHVGYNYDNIDSDLTARGYDRNRVYVGVTATF